MEVNRMRRFGLVPLMIVILLALPAYHSPVGSDIFSSPETVNPTDRTSQPAETGLISGTGASLGVSYWGTVTNAYDGTMTLDSSTPSTGTVTISDGWAGSDLQTSVDGISVEMNDLVQNSNLDSYHNETFLGTTSSADNDDDVAVPDSWILGKSGDSQSTHPIHGIFEMNDIGSSGYSGTMGWEFKAEWGIDAVLSSSDEIYLGQLVHTPYRELYSVDISFRYYISSSSSMADQVFLFVRFAGHLQTFHVFESGDSTGTWLQASMSVPSATIDSMNLPDSLLLEIGLATDLSDAQASARNAYAYIDEIALSAEVRPFPEQVNLKANGSTIVGWESNNVYVYEPDHNTRDCWDEPGSGISLDGNYYVGSTADPSVGIYGGGWSTANPSQVGIQFPVNIPQGAVVTSAFLEVEPESLASSGNPDMRVYVSGFGSGGGSVTNFSSGLPELEDRYEWADTSVDWQVGVRWLSDVRIQQRSPELGALFQSVISDSRWTSGDFVVVMLDYMHSASYQARNSIKGAYGSRFSQMELPRLFVEYKIPLPDDELYTFSYEKDITVDHTKVAADLTDFPIMIELFDTDLRTKVQSDGDDIAFRMGGTALDFEIEYFNQAYNSTHARLVAWVNLPTLSSSVDSTFTMAYGNPNARSSSSARLWDSYATVHHMNEDPSGTLYDSTSNNHLGTSYGVQGTEDALGGRIDGAIDFDDEQNDVIGIGQVDTDSWAGFTMSAWVYQDESHDCRVFSKSDTTTPAEHVMTMRINGQNPTFRISTDGTGGLGSNYDSNATVTLGQWHHIVWRWSAADARILAYLDGAPILDATHDGDTILDSVEVFTLGNNELTNARYFDGRIDEARLTTQVLTAEWILTEYNNQKNPSTFLSASSERVLRATWQDEDRTILLFSTSSPDSVTLDVTMTMDIEGTGQSLDENLDEGTSYYVANGSDYVEWTANVLVSPPNNTESMNAEIDYPMTQWGPTQVINPLGQTKTYGTDWDYDGSTLTIYSSAVDVFGVWTLKFRSWNYVEDLQLGISGQLLSDTATLNIDDALKVRATMPWIQNARAGLVLTDPSGSVWHTTY
ncbi:hypothetical protein EU546_05500, partial [Candidatus Thorarchaeota archaeon]